MATIKDIAKRAGVSVATVSYVLNNTRPVHPEKEKKILQAIEEFNYVPNATARGLRAKQNKTIALVVPDIANPFYPDLAKGCQDVAKENGYTLMMYNTNENDDWLEEISINVREGKIDGLILASLMNSDKKELNELLDTAFPIVVAHRKLTEVNVDSVVANNFAGAYVATKHLISLGHQKIALVKGSHASPVSQERLNGYLSAIRENFLRENILNGEGHYKKSFESVFKSLKSPIETRPTAIFASSDQMALGVLDAAKDVGLSVPNDLAIVGFDNLFLSASRSIEMSTIHVPRYEIGELATKALLNKMKKHTKTEDISSPSKNITLETNLIVRKTSGKPIINSII